MDVTTRPPTRLSDLIDLAIADARRLDHGDYAPSWDTWHEPRQDGTCMICLAGAVIARTLDCNSDMSIDLAIGETETEEFTIIDQEWRNGLRALDSVRDGRWCAAFERLHGIHADNKLKEALDELAPPARPEFDGWNQFEEHLDSLASRAHELRALDL